MTAAVDQERLRRLEQANRVRHRRAEWKRRLRAHDASLTDVMGDPLTDTMKVIDVLLALRGVGRVRAGNTLRHLGASPTATLGSLTYRQRVELETRFRRMDAA